MNAGQWISNRFNNIVDIQQHTVVKVGELVSPSPVGRLFGTVLGTAVAGGLTVEAGTSTMEQFAHTVDRYSAFRAAGADRVEATGATFVSGCETVAWGLATAVAGAFVPAAVVAGYRLQKNANAEKAEIAALRKQVADQIGG